MIFGKKNAPERTFYPETYPYLAHVGLPRHYIESVISEFEFTTEEFSRIMNNYHDNIHDIFNDCVNLTLSGGNGGGKAMPLYSKVLTPSGWVPLGELKRGDKIFSKNGKLTKVLEIYPQGIKDNYRVHFLDGRSAECCDEHLWSCFTSRGNLKTFSLREMMDIGFRKSGGKAFRFFVPNNECVQYNESTLPIDPYVFGVLLGDGCLSESQSGVMFSSVEEDIILKVGSALGGDYEVRKLNSDNYTWTIRYTPNIYKNPLKSALIEMGLHKKSIERFIPTKYLQSSEEQRTKLLHGLMDTEGNVYKGRFSFSSLSRKLAEDFMELSRSLGYQCSLSTFDRVSDNKGIEYQVQLLTDKPVFSSKKHLTKFMEYNEHKFGKNKSKYSRTAIVGAEYLGKEDMRCILVEDPSHLYLTNDFIVTHNTFLGTILLVKAFRSNYSVRRIIFPNFISECFNHSDYEEWGVSPLKNAIETEFLLIDEIGKENDLASRANITLLETLLKKREENGFPNIICTNLTKDGILKRYGETIHSVVVNQSIFADMDVKDRRKEMLKKKIGYQKVMGT